MNKYWLGWFIGWFSTFIVPEILMLAKGQPQNTLSGAVWQMEKLVPGQSPLHWDAAHMLFTAVFIVLAVWLIGHFGWGIWR